LSRVLGNGHALVLRGARHSNVPGLPVQTGAVLRAAVASGLAGEAEVSDRDLRHAKPRVWLA